MSMGFLLDDKMHLEYFKSANEMDSVAKDYVLVHYLFFDPEYSHDSPLPLRIPRAIYDNHTRSGREFFALELLNECQCECKPERVKFWKPKEPLSVDSPSKTGWTRTVEEFKDSFDLIPFTRSFALALGDSIDEHDLVHLVVTATDVVYKEDFRLRPRYEKLGGSIDLGSFVTQDARNWKDKIVEGGRHSKYFGISLKPTIPNILLGLHILDLGSKDGALRIMARTDNLTDAEFRCHIDSWGRVRLHKAAVNWLVTDLPNFQSAVVDAEFYRRSEDGTNIIQRINFKRPFDAPPKIVLALSGFGLGGGNWDIRTSATNVDSRGFTINITKTREENKPWTARVHWLAFPENLPGVCSGGFSTEEEFGAAKGHIEFNKDFKTIPSVFLALTQFDADKRFNLRLHTEISNVTTSGMDWELRTWSDTVLHSAGASFLAIEMPPVEPTEEV